MRSLLLRILREPLFTFAIIGGALFLAYAGTSLPLLLLFVEANQGFTNVVTREIVATEVVRTLVGSIGLVASVPISTWLAAMVVSGGDGADPVAD